MASLLRNFGPAALRPLRSSSLALAQAAPAAIVATTALSAVPNDAKSTSAIKDAFAAKIPAVVEEVKTVRGLYGDEGIGTCTVTQAYGCMRSVKFARPTTNNPLRRGIPGPLTAAVRSPLAHGVDSACRAFCVPASASPVEAYRHVLTSTNINPRVLDMQYAVRGQIVLRAQEMLRENRGDVVFCNIGNPQSVGQQPITFLRQVLAAAVYPPAAVHMPLDVQARAEAIIRHTNGSGMGAYSESKGLDGIRQSVADFIERRDNAPDVHRPDPQHIFLTNGASDAVKALLAMVIRSESDGVMIPIPQYPLYSAAITFLGGAQVPYFLDEENRWAMSRESLQKAFDDAKAKGTTPRALAVINPGNPTGQVLGAQTMRDVVLFCEENHVLLMADEVYQTNVYQPRDRPFISFRKIATEMGSPVELASFHSVSKGMIGECGLRGGYMEVVNFTAEAIEQVYKSFSVSLCSNLPGQVAVDIMVNPPRPGDQSFELYDREMSSIYNGLARKAEKVAKGLNQFKGIFCNDSDGAMYAFPRISLPAGAIAAAERAKQAPDFMYAMALLEETGICVVPGSGFGQVAGSYHFRTTFLPPEEKIDQVLMRMESFHNAFLEKHSA